MADAVNSEAGGQKPEVRGRGPGAGDQGSGIRLQFSILNFILAAFVALCLVYNVTLPVFEAPDEASHFRYAHYLANERRLPDLKRDLPSHEVTQPVLYYALAALVISPFDRSNLDQLVLLNPDWFDRSLNQGYTGVRGQHIHTEAERWPYQGAVWAVRAARLLSSLLGAATIALVYLIARDIFTGHAVNDASRPLIANLCAALVAFNPKFIHISSVVSNDIAITLAATATCWWMVRMANQPGMCDRVPLRRFFILGALVAAATLCKLQGLGLLAPALAAVFLVTPRERLSGRIVALLAGFFAVAGWWFVFNTLNYGHPLAWAQVQEANAALLRIPPLGAGEILATLPLWFTSYWGNLGIELHYDDWVNAVLFVALALAVIGCVVAFARKLPMVGNRAGFALLMIWQVTIAAMFAWWLRSYVGTENSRLIMPGVAPVVLLTAMGWLTLAPQRAWPAAAVAGAGSLLALAIAAPFVTIRPAYALPSMMSREGIVAAHQLPSAGVATFDGVIELLHAEVGTKRVKPGEHLDVTLYWGARQPVNQSYRVVLEALDLDGEVIGRKMAIPFGGRFATQRWQPGAYFRDDYRLPIGATAPRGPARVQLSLFKLYPEPGAASIDGANTRAFLIDRVKVEAATTSPPESSQPPIAVFGDVLRLDRVRFAPDQVTFDWTALRPPGNDYTLFVHVLDANGAQIGQKDAEPFDGQYPTGLWDAGERVRDVRAIALPPEARWLRIGWYDRQTGQRLAARMADGSPWPDDIVFIEIP
ncbi:MAG: glycosyltransferase family 39 protein [Anaerolineae bacterium]|nr:glycosyltransferase family 39 protein [Candidatus Roseilinea sp.]MDW8448950.1 glycosyltransferase family 39 protein [Anaerolineae bacterium]